MVLDSHWEGIISPIFSPVSEYQELEATGWFSSVKISAFSFLVCFGTICEPRECLACKNLL